MDAIKMGIGFGLWQQGMPDAPTLFAYIDKAEAWGIDSVWLSDHMMGERADVSEESADLSPLPAPTSAGVLCRGDYSLF